MNRRDFLRTTGTAGGLAIVGVSGRRLCNAGESQEADAAAGRPLSRKLPRWRGFNLLEKFMVPEQEQKELFAIVESTKGDIVAVVGDGHIEGLGRRLAGETLEVVRLRDLRDPAGSAGTSATISYRL